MFRELYFELHCLPGPLGEVMQNYNNPHMEMSALETPLIGVTISIEFWDESYS